MPKWFGFLFVLLLISCQHNEKAGMPTATVSTATGIVIVEETAVSPSTTPIPPTNTPTKSPTIQPTATQTPTLTPTPIAQFTPPTLPPVTIEAGSSAQLYQLRPWSDAEAAALTSLMTDYAEQIKSDWELNSRFGDKGRKQILEIGNEFILRYPNSPYRAEVEWKMVDASTYFGKKPMNELFAKLIATDLNAGIATLDNFDTYLKSYGFQIDHRICQSCDLSPNSIPNLLGDGREIPIFVIQRQTEHFDGGLLIAVWQDENGTFIVTPIISQWAAMKRFSGGISTLEARHITGSPQPELVVKSWGHSGSMIRSSLHMYRWNGENFVELAGTPFGLSGGTFGDELTFVDGDNPSRLQIFSNYDNRTAIFEWQDGSYQIVDVIFANEPPGTTDSFFSSEQIQREIANENYLEVITYLENELNASKPDTGYKPYESPSQLAMRFILGMNYVYLEDEEVARSIFETLRNETTPPELIGFSQAADAFLEHYDGLETAYEGCRAAYEIMVETELELSDISDLMPLCAFDKLILNSLTHYNGIGDPFELIDAAEIIQSQQFDLNKNEQLDWLFAVAHPTVYVNVDVEVWALLLEDERTEVVKITTLRARQQEFEEISLDIHVTQPFDTPLIGIHSNNDFRISQLLQSEDGWTTKRLMGNGITTGYTLQFIDNTLQLDTLIDPMSTYKGTDRIRYHWDAETEGFIEVSRHANNSLDLPFEVALDSAESFIFEHNDFASAIPILTTIVNEFDPNIEYSYQFSLPKTLYLLGLAHELQGNESQAVAAYWQLWHDHPTDPYALMAASKLEEK